MWVVSTCRLLFVAVCLLCLNVCLRVVVFELFVGCYLLVSVLLELFYLIRMFVWGTGRLTL